MVASGEGALPENVSPWIEAFPDGVLIVGNLGQVVSVNSTAVRILGYEPGELLGRRVDTVFPDATSLNEPDLWKQAGANPSGVVRLQTGLPSNARRKDASIVRVEVQAAPIRLPGFNGILCTLRQTKPVEPERPSPMSLVERSLAEAQETTHVGSWEWRLPTGEFSWSDELYRLHGHEPGAFPVSFDRTLELVDPSDRERVRQHWLELRKLPAPKGPLRAIEFRILAADRGPRWIRSESRAFGDAHGNPERLIGTYQDITESKLEERKLLSGLHQAAEIELLRERDQFKTQLINIAAHELATPLTPIKLQVHLLKQGIEQRSQADQEKSLEILDRNVDRLAALVKDILEVARLQAGRLPIRKERFDLQKIVEEAVASFRQTAQHAGLSFTSDSPNGVFVFGDPKRVVQVLFNLIDNAIKFTSPPGRVHVEVRTNGGEALVHVKDSGVGMTAEQMSKLFQPFTQVHEHLVPGRKGTGLGLFIGRSIIELHGGKIWAESDGPGQGSSFRFSVPLVTVEPPTRVRGPVPQREEEIHREEAFSKRLKELV